MRSTPKAASLALLLTLCFAGPAAADGDAAIEFLTPYGLQNFSQHYIDALQALLCAQDEYDAGNYAEAKTILDALWAQYPVGHVSWAALPTQPFGINIGSPPCYYALRMLSDVTDWKLDNPKQGPAPGTARLTVLVVGQTNGIEPQNEQDINDGTGIQVVHNLDPRVEENGYAAVHESLHLFKQYTLAVTKGLLDVETQILPLPDVNLPVHAFVLPSGGYYAGLVDASQVWPDVPTEDIAATDWWWILYPSHVPEQYPDFENSEFITGGMGTGADSVSPFFIIDDRWIVRKPPHLGDGEYTPLERGVYLPQWMQHEFYHHLYRTWPEFGLEDESHQWFDPANWPPDFEGMYEPDYYHESLYKRLHFADPSTHVGLRYATADGPWDQLTIDDVLGSYHRLPVENPWHIGDIHFSGPQLEWLNTAPVSWNLQDDLINGALLTGPDCPYYNLWNGKSFNIVLEREDVFGDLTTELRGFRFLGELYTYQPPPCPADLDGDGHVGVPDFLALLIAWGPCPDCPEDLDGDGYVGIQDFLALLIAWGPCP